MRCEKSEQQKGFVTCPGSHSYLVAELGMKLRLWFYDAFSSTSLTGPITSQNRVFLVCGWRL